MKKYSCSRCNTSLILANGEIVPHYNMKDSKARHLRLNKTESFVCSPCVDKKEKAKEATASGEIK